MHIRYQIINYIYAPAGNHINNIRTSIYEGLIITKKKKIKDNPNQR
jgi:hypothetical protein